MLYLFFFLFISLNIYGVEHPLEDCERTTLLDSSKESSKNFSDDKAGVKQIINTIHSQKGYGACLLASFSTELNYLIRRKYKESNEVLSFNYLQYISKQCGVKQCSLKEMRETLKAGNYLDDTFNKLVEIESENFKKFGRGLCFQPYLEEVKMNSLSTNDPNYYFAPITIIHYYLQSDKDLKKILDVYPELNSQTCNQEDKDEQLACMIDNYFGYFNPQSIRQCHMGTFETLINDVRGVLKNDKRGNFFELFQPLIEAPLDCKGKLSQEPILSEMKSHHGVLHKYKVDDKTVIVKPGLFKKIQKECETLIPDSLNDQLDCIFEKQGKVCKEKNGCREMWDFYENAISHPNMNARRPITIGASMKLFRPVADIFGFVKDPLDGHHAMAAIGTATCKQKKCLLLQNSWGTERIPEEKIQWEDSYKLRSVYPYKIDSKGRMDYSRMWVCGDELIKENIKQINYIQSYRPLL